MRFATYTFGCKVNQYETQAMESVMIERGHQRVDFDDNADIYIINTCSVTAVSDKKCRNMIRRTRREHSDAILAVCGCYSQHEPELVQSLGVNVIGGTGQRVEFLNNIEKYAVNRISTVNVDDALRRKDLFEILPAGGMNGRTRAMLKVEDGCQNFCTYCIIPYTRGRVRSLSVSSAIEQVTALEKAGYKEVVITGIEISSWGVDLKNNLSIIDLLESVCNAVPNMRVRMGSFEPRTITEEFCMRAKKLQNLCPHFHLSLQSGCDETLKRMHRRYNSERFLQSCELLRTHFDNPAITTDLICGFPGETEDEFTETLSFIQKAQFSSMHIFPYSRRPGTVADNMPNQLSTELKNLRCHRVAQIADKLEQNYLNMWIGKVLPVLFEEPSQNPDSWQGHAPNYLQVSANGSDLHNILKNVEITAVEDNHLVGKILD